MSISRPALRRLAPLVLPLLVAAPAAAGVIVVDDAGHILDINPAGLSLLGFERKEDLLRVNIAEELYLSVLLDRAQSRLIVMASTEGGMEIEKVADETPELILRETIDPAIGLAGFQAAPAGSTRVGDLERLAKLLEDGHISREEYEAQKRRLLGAD